jgi:antitoxin MazE
LGNSRGVIIPKAILQRVGLEAKAEVVIEQSAIILRKQSRSSRPGWAEYSRKLAEAGNDKLVWPEFGGRDDRALQW